MRPSSPYKQDVRLDKVILGEKDSRKPVPLSLKQALIEEKRTLTHGCLLSENIVCTYVTSKLLPLIARTTVAIIAIPPSNFHRGDANSIVYVNGWVLSLAESQTIKKALE